jgi:hypothetical protein
VFGAVEPPPFVPPPQDAAAEVPTASFEEYDLEDYREEVAEPVSPESAEISFEEPAAEADVVDLDADMATLIDSENVAEQGGQDLAAVLPASEEVAVTRAENPDIGEDEWPVRPSPDDFDQVGTVAEAIPQEPPPWAVTMMEEIQRLRGENNGLRVALQGITALLDSQVHVLQQGREELTRLIGEIPGERD